MTRLRIDREVPPVARVYDIKDCGPRNRFIANGVLVHNSGGDRLNWQNMTRGSVLRNAVVAPEGHTLVVGDSASIEARVLDWLAGQEDMVQVYRDADAKVGPEPYCVMAQSIYGRPITKEDDPDERQVGKVAKLGLGYGMGAEKFQRTAWLMARVRLTDMQAKSVVDKYRSVCSKIPVLWKRMESALPYLTPPTAKLDQAQPIDIRGVIQPVPFGLQLPSGLVIRYTDLKRDASGWSYYNGRERVKLYGGKIVENCVQALARIIVLEQTLAISKRYPVVMSVHDEVVVVVQEGQEAECLAYVKEVMATPPSWAPDLPLASGVGAHKSYGKAKPK